MSWDLLGRRQRSSFACERRLQFCERAVFLITRSASLQKAPTVHWSIWTDYPLRFPSVRPSHVLRTTSAPPPADQSASSRKGAPFASCLRSICPRFGGCTMPKSRRQLRVVLPALERSNERSSLFWWMLEHHDEMLAAVSGRRPRWVQLCATFATLDLKDGQGNLPSPEAARRTWRNVREFAASAVATSLRKPRPKYPSRISPDWRPQTVVPPPPIRAPPPGPVPIPSSATAVTNPAATDKSREGLESLDRAFALLEADDRRKFRFGG